jgi:hypothetical protein
MGVNMRRLYILALGVLVLNGCQGGGIGRAGSGAWRMTASPIEQENYYRGVCLDKGYSLGSPEIAACMASKPRSVTDDGPDVWEKLERGFKKAQENLPKYTRYTFSNSGVKQCLN